MFFISLPPKSLVSCLLFQFQTRVPKLKFLSGKSAINIYPCISCSNLHTVDSAVPTFTYVVALFVPVSQKAFEAFGKKIKTFKESGSSMLSAPTESDSQLFGKPWAILKFNRTRSSQYSENVGCANNEEIEITSVAECKRAQCLLCICLFCVCMLVQQYIISFHIERRQVKNVRALN